MVCKNDIPKLNKIVYYLKKSDCSIIVVEVNNRLLQNESINYFENNSDVEIIEVRNGYLSKIEHSTKKNIILINFFDKFMTAENVANEINYNRDVYISYKKNIIFFIPTCVIDVIIENFYSFWSCISVHEKIDIKIFNPFSYLPFILDTTLVNNSKEELTDDFNTFLKNKLCDRIMCNNKNRFKCQSELNQFCFNKCFEYHKQSQVSQRILFLRMLTIGNDLMKTKDLDKSLYFFDAVKNLANDCDNRCYSLSEVCLANYYCLKNEYERAVSSLNLAFKFETDRLQKHKICNDLAILLYKTNQSQKQTYNLLKQAEDFFIDEERYDNLAIVEYNIAIFYYNINNYHCSLDYINKALNLSNLSTIIKLRLLFFKSLLLIISGQFDENLTEILNVIKSYMENESIFGELIEYDYQYINALYEFSIGHVNNTFKYLRKITWSSDCSENNIAFALFSIRAALYYILDIRKITESEINFVRKKFGESFLYNNLNIYTDYLILFC